MTIDHAALLDEAHAYAQRCFAAMMQSKSYSDPDAPETRAYVRAERIVDEFLAEVQWERSKAAMDALQAGDHHVYPEPVL